MGFLDKIFGPREKPKIVLELSEVKPFLEKEISRAEGNFDTVVASKFSEIKHLLKELKHSLNELEKSELTENENERLSKIVETSRDNTIRQLNSLIQKISPPESKELSVLQNYCLNASRQLQQEINHFGKNIAYTSIYLREEIKKVGEQVKELNSVLVSLQNECEKNRSLFSAIEAISFVEKMNEKINKIESIKKSIALTKEELKKLQNKRDLLLKNLDALNSSQEFKELDALQQKKSEILREKQELKSKVVELIGNVEKPLKRFKKLVDAKKYVLDKEVETALNNYLTNPFLALKRDPKAQMLKSVLRELKKALEENLISLKEKALEKKVSAIDELLSFDFFENIFWKLNKLDVSLKNVEEEMQEKEINKKISSVGSQLKELEKEIEEKGFSLNTEKELLEKEEEMFSTQKQRIENVLRHFTKSDVEIK